MRLAKIKEKFISDLSETSKNTIYLALWLFGLSSIAILINIIHFHYPANLYLPPYAPLNAISVSIMYVGYVLLNGSESSMAHTMRDFFCLILITMLVTYCVNAAQLTPFPAIDHALLRFEDLFFHVNYPSLLAWVNTSPRLYKALTFAYSSLPYFMIYFPILIIFARRTKNLYEYYYLSLINVLIGFTIYYFFPTIAPAGTIDSPYFLDVQRATSLKFNQIHHHIPPSTIEGGLIAFPSFHVIWGWLSLYMVRCWPILFTAILPLYLMVVASCFLLGWHYLIDILGSVGVLVIAHLIYYFRHAIK